MFLYVPERYVSWWISSSTSATDGVWIQSGRGTNSPTSPHAGHSVRLMNIKLTLFIIAHIYILCQVRSVGVEIQGEWKVERGENICQLY